MRSWREIRGDCWRERLRGFQFQEYLDLGALIGGRHINRLHWTQALRALHRARSRKIRESLTVLLAAAEEFDNTLNAAIALAADRPELALAVTLQFPTNANVCREAEAAPQACRLTAEERQLEAEKVRILDRCGAALAGLLLERYSIVEWRM